MVKKINRKGLTIVEMAIVLLLMSVLLTIIFSLVQNFSIFKSTNDESQILKDLYLFAKRTSVKSGQVLFLDLDLDNNSYKIYRKIRKEDFVEEQILTERKLFFTNRIISIRFLSGRTVDSGKVSISFYPQNYNDEIYIYLGSENQIHKTVIFPKYGLYGIIKNGEYYENNPTSEILEKDESEKE